MDYYLVTENIEKSYNNTKVLKGINIHIPKGAIYGFVGKNGAGKTTLMRIICGLQLQSAGKCYINGIESTDKNIFKERKKMSAVIETPSFFPNMSAEQNLKYHFDLLGMPSYDNIADILKLVELDNTHNKPVCNFSLGMRQRLGIALALCSNPDFIVLDEPTNGLDPQGIVQIRELIIKLNKEKNITVLISSHILSEMEKLATHYGFIDNGNIVKEMTAEELETICRKTIKINVNDTKKLSLTLDNLGIEYKIFDNNNANIFSDINITELVLKLYEQNCIVNNIFNNNESLENFFISLVEGENNA